MFTTVRYFVKTSLVFLVIGILTGFTYVIQQIYLSKRLYTGINSAHTHIILVGSVMMMIMGVAFWFFPRAEKDDKKYNPDLILVTYWMMTISTAMRFIMQIIGAYYYIAWVNACNCSILIFSGLGDDFIFLFNVGKNKSSWQSVS
ncbi:MAG: cbb3-type cytochrome c oxidase subunit I [Ignavibacteriales bacterium]|nr:cbb3-type cytochrome c oxidase subunit I [Ignavibacteriales bacterium]